MKDIVVMCSGILDPGNLGALARLCDNFDAKHLIAINPQCRVTDKSYHRATRGKQFLDNLIVLDSVEKARKYVDMIIGLSSRTGAIDNLSRPAISIQEISHILNDVEGSIGILLGPEDHGLDNKEVNQCDLLVHIPLPSDNQILNISHAAVVALWEIVREANYSSIDKNKTRLMKRDEKEKFLEYLSKILEHSWLDEEKYESTIKVFRTILSRSQVTHREAPALVGTMRLILKSFEVGPPPDQQSGSSDQ